MQFLKSPWLAVVLSVASFLLGVGDVPFTDADTFSKFLTEHGVQFTGIGAVAYAAFHLLKRVRDHIDPDIIRNALQNGTAQINDIVRGVEATGDAAAVRTVKTSAVDAAWVTLYHGADDDPDVTAKINDAHSLYRAKRCTIETTAKHAS